jgi:alpha-amylase
MTPMPTLLLPTRVAIAASAAVILAGACALPTTVRDGQGADTAPVDTAPVAMRSNDSALPAGWEQGPFMRIFVRAYQDSNADGVGDLAGLTQRLDHLKDLGIKGLSLLPITASADRDPGDATLDARRLDPELGTLQDLETLLREAHRRGIGVVLDHPVNHGSASSALFASAASSASTVSTPSTVSPYRDWYVWSETAPQGWDVAGRYPWYHAASRPWTWAGRVEDVPRQAPGARGSNLHYYGVLGPHKPDFDWRNPRVLDYHVGSLRHWLNRGVDGFRLEGVSFLVENGPRQWMDQPQSRQIAGVLAEAIEAYPNRYAVCDAAAEPIAHADPKVCGAAMAFDVAEHFAKAARGEAASVRVLADHVRRAPATMGLYVSDPNGSGGSRLWDQVGGDVLAYKLAASSYLLQAGTPFIAYGEEVGQAASRPGVGPNEPGAVAEGSLADPGQRGRAPMSWAADNLGSSGFSSGAKAFRPSAPNLAAYNVAAQRSDPNSILAHYKDVIALRNARTSIARGVVEASNARGTVWSVVRASGTERTLLVYNYGARPVSVDVAGLPRRARLAPIYPRRAGAAAVAEITLADARGHTEVDVPARAVVAFDVEVTEVADSIEPPPAPSRRRRGVR